jgi:hypothetical protein
MSNLPKDPDEAYRAGADILAAADKAWRTNGAAPDCSDIPSFLKNPRPNDNSPDPGVYGEEWGDDMPPRSPITATPFVWIDPASIPKREFLYGRHYIRGFMSTTIAPGGGWKDEPRRR